MKPTLSGVAIAMSPFDHALFVSSLLWVVYAQLRCMLPENTAIP